MFECSVCGKIFETKQKLGGHISSHNRKNESYSKTRIKSFDENGKPQRKKDRKIQSTCKFCGVTVDSSKIGGHVSRCSKNPNIDITLNKVSNSKVGKNLSIETKLKVSNGMKLAHQEGRAWNIGQSRWNNEPSYPEQFFMKVIENEFDNKEYVREFPMKTYSIDFAWPQLKLAIEIDGDQHERFEEYKRRDQQKDQYLISQGWKVLRISWKQIHRDTKTSIQLLKNFINNGH